MFDDDAMSGMTVGSITSNYLLIFIQIVLYDYEVDDYENGNASFTTAVTDPASASDEETVATNASD